MSFSSMTSVPGQRGRQETEHVSQPTGLREILQKLQRQPRTTDSDGIKALSTSASPGPSRERSVGRHRSRGDDPSVSRKHNTMSNQSPLEPTGWRLSTAPVQLGSPLSLRPSLDHPWNSSPTSPRAEDGTFLQQLKQYTRAHLDEDRTDQARPQRNSVAGGDHRNSNNIMVSDHTRRDPLRASANANTNLILSTPRHQTVYMPESPVTTGDKRIRQRKESEAQHVDKKKMILGHPFGKNSRDRPPRAANRKRALLPNETEEERRKREKESVEAWRVRPVRFGPDPVFISCSS
jgi:hypothetical protein